MNFKVGDRVICVPGFSNEGTGNYDLLYGGHGYEQGKAFIIVGITINNQRNVIWSEDLIGGVFEDAIRIYEPIKPYKHIKKLTLV